MTNDFPMLERGPTKLAFPWALLAPHEQQAIRNHGGQTLERLAERGGLSASEMLAILEDRDWTPVPFEIAYERLQQIRRSAIGAAQ